MGRRREGSVPQWIRVGPSNKHPYPFNPHPLLTHHPIYGVPLLWGALIQIRRVRYGPLRPLNIDTFVFQQHM